jgi:hypothetical protein
MVDLKDFFNKKYTYAIVGASNNEKKYGYKIFKTLIEGGFKAIPINPKDDKILDIKAYPSLYDVDERIDVVDFVVPPNVTLNILDEMCDLEIEKAWFQPGSFDERCIKRAKEYGIKYLKDFCLYEQVLRKL